MGKQRIAFGVGARGLALAVVGLSIGACGEAEETPATEPPAVGAAPLAPASEGEGEGEGEPGEGASSSPAAAEAPAGGRPALPRAEGVLPPAEVSRGSLVVAGEGFRYQVPSEGFAPVEMAGALGQEGYRGDVRGMLGPARLELWVTRHAYEGDEATAAREQEAEAMVLLPPGSRVRSLPDGMLNVAGLAAPHPRFRVVERGREELRAIAVHGGQVWTFHCRVVSESPPWLNAGSDCMIRATTFHVAPPAGPGAAGG